MSGAVMGGLIVVWLGLSFLLRELGYFIEANWIWIFMELRFERSELTILSGANEIQDALKLRGTDDFTWRRGFRMPSDVGINTRDEFDVVISGNLIYDSDADGIIEGSKVIMDRQPRFKYTLWIEPEAAAQMKHLHFTGNLFPPGELGVSNVELNP